MGTMTNPLLDEINGLSPNAKSALMQAHQSAQASPNPLIAAGKAQMQGAAQAGPEPGPLMMPPSARPSVPSIGMKSPEPLVAGPQGMKAGPWAPQGTIKGDEQEHQRLLNTGPGVDQIQGHPFLKGLAKVADAVNPFVAIPGTTAHHNLLLKQNSDQLTGEIGNAQKEAQTANLEAMPELNQAKQELAQRKQEETETNHQAQVEQHLRSIGYKTDEKGAVVPLSYDEMSPQQQGIHDLKASQEELADASAALKKAQADPNSPQARIAQQRLEGAQQARQIALQRLGLSERIYNARYLGVGDNGEALPGAMITDEGQPVGSSFSQNVRPTGTERNKADMAGSAKEQLDDIASIVAKHPQLFGPGYGQTSAFRQWLGSQDPDAQRFIAARTIAGDHLAGTFGGRSEAALNALDTAIGKFKDNPAALKAGLDQLTKANERFLKAGSPRTAGSKVNAEAQAAPSFKVKLTDAMALPQNKGKSEADVEADVKKHGGEVVR